jgi:hypothetical protein
MVNNIDCSFHSWSVRQDSLGLISKADPEKREAVLVDSLQ